MSSKITVTWYHKMLNHFKLSSLFMAPIAGLFLLPWITLPGENWGDKFPSFIAILIFLYFILYNILVLLYNNRINQADSFFKKSLASYETGDFDTSIEQCKKSIYIYGQMHGTEDSFGLFYLHLGDAYLRQKNYKNALESYKKAICLYKKTSKENEDLARSYFLLGHCYIDQGNYNNGIRVYQKALSMQKRVLPSGHEDIAHTEYFLKKALQEKKEA